MTVTKHGTSRHSGVKRHPKLAMLQHKIVYWVLGVINNSVIFSTENIYMYVYLHIVTFLAQHMHKHYACAVLALKQINQKLRPDVRSTHVTTPPRCSHYTATWVQLDHIIITTITTATVCSELLIGLHDAAHWQLLVCTGKLLTNYLVTLSRTESKVLYSTYLSTVLPINGNYVCKGARISTPS